MIRDIPGMLADYCNARGLPVTWDYSDDESSDNDEAEDGGDGDFDPRGA